MFFKLLYAPLISLVLCQAYAQTTPREISKTIFTQSVVGPEKNDPFRYINLNGAIEEGLRQNHNEKIRNLKKEILDINWSDTKYAFWLPSPSLNLNATSKIGKLKNGSLGGSTSKTPSGVASLDLGEYVIFNWGKDYLQFLNDKNSYKRGIKNLKEKRRDLKHDLIVMYFELNLVKEVEKVRKDQLRHASFIYRLNKEKFAVRKIKQQDFLLARAEYLRAQTNYHQAISNSQTADEKMALLINDKIGTRYLLKENLKYDRLKISQVEALRISRKRNPSILDSEKNISNAKRDYDLAKKENLPLPKISVNLGAYNKHFSGTQNRTFYETSTDNSDVEIIATINASWPLIGEGGLFNSRKRKRALLYQNISFQELEFAKRKTAASIKTQFRNIYHYQKLLEILEVRVPSLQKTFDTILENYINKRTPYNDMHLSLEELIQAEILLVQTKFLHLREKVLLAKEIGLEDFPGENFEKLASLKEGIPTGRAK